MCQTWSVFSARGMQCVSFAASAESNRQSSTLVACSEKRAKLTPAPSQVAPKGYGRPGQMRRGVTPNEERSARVPEPIDAHARVESERSKWRAEGRDETEGAALSPLKGWPL